MPESPERSPSLGDAIESAAVRGGRTIDDLYDALASERRRRLLRELDGCDGPVGLRALATRLADSAEGSAAASSTLVTLYHVHLPKLVDVGLVDSDDEGVSLTPSGRDVAAQV